MYWSLFSEFHLSRTLYKEWNPQDVGELINSYFSKAFQYYLLKEHVSLTWCDISLQVNLISNITACMHNSLVWKNRLNQEASDIYQTLFMEDHKHQIQKSIEDYAVTTKSLKLAWISRFLTTDVLSRKENWKSIADYFFREYSSLRCRLYSSLLFKLPVTIM